MYTFYCFLMLSVVLLYKYLRNNVVHFVGLVSRIPYQKRME